MKLPGNIIRVKQIERIVQASLSAYLATDGNNRGLTSTGHQAQAGIAAVDPRYIPYGTRIKVPGLRGTYIADDTGGAIQGHRIDLCFGRGYAAYKAAMNFGRRELAVILISPKHR